MKRTMKQQHRKICQMGLLMMSGGLVFQILSHAFTSQRSHGGLEGRSGRSLATESEVIRIPQTVNEERRNPMPPSKRFNVYEDLPMDYTCNNLQEQEQELQNCKKMQQLLGYIQSDQEETQSSPLFIVPMDYLAMQMASNANETHNLLTVINTITTGFRYVHFGGSDHVFLCLTSGCGTIMEEILRRHSLGNDTRAMWIGAENDLHTLREQWPCPDRVLNAPESLLAAMGLSTPKYSSNESTIQEIRKGADALLQNALQRIEGMNRWACSKERWNLSLDYTQRDKSKSCIAVVRHKLCVTTIKNCASTSVNALLRRMSGISDSNTTSSDPHSPQGSLAYIRPFYNRTAHSGNQTDTSIVKVAVLRDPEDRFVSGYKSKILRQHENWRVGIDMDILTIPTVDEVLDSLTDKKERGEFDSVDPHFRPQCAFGNLRHARYDFVATVSSLSNDLETILKSLSLWEEYGAFGWGGQSNVSLTEYKSENVRRNIPGAVELTQDQRAKLYSLYHEDYQRFGFPMENM